MFDTVFGLPTHIFVIHAVVVLGPIAALMAIAYTARAPWRPALKWPLVALAVVTGITGAIAGQSGEALEHRVKAKGGSAEQLALLHDHTEAGDLAQALCMIFLVVVVVAVFWGLRPVGASGPIALVSKVVLVLMSLVLIGSLTVTGHTGASVSWSDLPAASSSDGGDD